MKLELFPFQTSCEGKEAFAPEIRRESSTSYKQKELEEREREGWRETNVFRDKKLERKCEQKRKRKKERERERERERVGILSFL